MVTCLGDLHIWTLKNQTIIPDTDTGCFTYHEKNETVTNAEQPYYEEKLQYTESRDATWIPRNKRPEKLRDTLKEIEDTLAIHKCVKCRWLNKRLLQVFLANGTLVTLMISLHTGDIDKIMVDKTLVGKLTGELPSDVLFAERYIVVAYPDRTKLDYIYFTKVPPSGDLPKKLEKLSVYEPKVLTVEIPGPLGRRLDRHLSCSLNQDLVLAWWPTASEEAWPWSPMTGDKERANLVMLAANGPRFDVVTFTRTDGDPMDVIFSQVQPHQILTVEQLTNSAGEISADICMYEANRNRVQRLTVTTVPLKSGVVSVGRTVSEDRLVLGCEDNSLVVYDEYKKLTQFTSANITPHLVSWHPSGTLVMVANKRGSLQIFDMALSALNIELVAEHPGPQPTLEFKSYFRSPPTIDHLDWSPPMENQEFISECADALFIVCDKGPLSLLQLHVGVLSQGQLSPLHLVNQYVKHRQIDQAINLLLSLNWNLDGQTCYAALSTIINHLLRMPLNPDREAQLEAALGSFYAPARPLSEIVVLDYRDPISRLARRFFHHLLRFTRFDKAFLLAVDIGARDLFMDIHYLAQDKGETALAEVARRKAEQIETESVGTGSVDGYDDEEDSELGDSFEDSYDEDTASLEEAPLHGTAGAPPRPPRPPKRSSPSIGKPLPPVPPSPSLYAHPSPGGRFSSGRHHNRGQDQQHRQPWEQGYMYVPEAALQQLEEELSAEMFSEYTAALLDEIPPPQVGQDGTEENHQDGDQSSKSVKVVHFGVV